MRRALRARRRAFVESFDDAGRGEASAALATRVVERLGSARVVAGYVAVGAEADPAPILAAAAGRGVAIALPVAAGRLEPLRFAAWTPGDALVTGPLGLMQPAGGREVSPDLILAPLVGFDRALNRLGQGAAHYDRAFTALPHARRIGLGWSVQEVAALVVEPWDVPLHGVATEREWIGS